MKEASLEKEKAPCGTRDPRADTHQQTNDRCVIEMAPEAFDAFLDSLGAEPTEEELKGLRRLKNVRYPWENEPQHPD